MLRVGQAVFKGGGVKGIGLIGALAVAEEQGWRWRAVAGSSAGSLVAALVAAGYRAGELHQVIGELDLTRLLDRDRSRVAGLLVDEGLYKGEAIASLVDELLAAKLGRSGITFRELPVSCQVVVADLTYRRLLTLPDDLRLAPYSFTDPLSFPVAQAVRAGTALPLLFQPVRLDLPDGGQVTLVDGGLLSNFPLHLFQPTGGYALLPTIGFELLPPSRLEPTRTDTPLHLAQALVSTIFEGRDNRDSAVSEYARAIRIDTGDCRTTDFALDKERRAWLYQSGRTAAERFFASPETLAWLRSFPRRPPQG